ncbi:CNPY2 [Bugula neritina]|uniref:CNPY2 n=1 Tax=Bugula neritina TaxID=10212 RepID=A0A7J7KMM7_BUGNE|nr:CNPY2 [Bugula neritina]
MVNLLWFNIFLLMSAIMAHAKDMDLYCGACHMLVDEIHWEINQTDPKRTIQVGSFRIMPDGSQRLSELTNHYRDDAIILIYVLYWVQYFISSLNNTTED